MGFGGSIKKKIHKLFRKLIHSYEYDEGFNTLFYMLNTLVDISKIPPATGALRDLQLADLELLHIVDLVCKKHNLQYFLDYGTLLGAVRHNGFIPWDDDMDINMPRDDFEKAIGIINDELTQFGIDVEERDDEKLRRLCVGYKHYDTGVWLDVFPYDSCRCTSSAGEIRDELIPKLLKWRKYYHKNKLKKSRAELQKIKSSIIDTFEGGNIILYGAAEAMTFGPYIHDADDLYPIQEHEFEQYSFKIPNNPDSFLREVYGNNYMGFPRSGVAHHGNDKGAISNWASISGTNMSEVIQYLHSVAEKIESNN